MHVDFIKKLKKNEAAEPEEEVPKSHSKSWTLKRIVGEKGTTRRTKQWRVWWENNTITLEPGNNLEHAEDVVKAWILLSLHGQAVVTSMTAEELQATIDEAEDSPTIAVDATLTTKKESAWANLIQDISRCKFGDCKQYIMLLYVSKFGCFTLSLFLFVFARVRLF